MIYDYKDGYNIAKSEIVESTIEFLYEKYNNGEIDIPYMKYFIEEYKLRMGYEN